MGIGDIASASGEIIYQIGDVMSYLQTIGIILLIWIGIQIAVFFLQKKKLGVLKNVQKDISRLEEKIDYLIKKNKK